MNSIEAFIHNLTHFKSPGVFNPWSEIDKNWDKSASAPEDRQGRLKLHLSNPDVRYCLIAEAPGYQGCRMSGCAFTSERQIYEGLISRMSEYSQVRLSTRKLPFTEPSATVVWRTADKLGISDEIVLWNAFAWHPFGDKELSNRTPTIDEFKAGLSILEEFLALMASTNPQIKLFAVGKKAEATLKRLGVSPDATIRHPARGGASEFHEGLRLNIGKQ